MLTRVAASGREAIVAVTQGDTPRFDVALIDAALPDMTGGELLRRLREHRVTAELPAILLVSGADPASEDDGVPGQWVRPGDDGGVAVAAERGPASDGGSQALRSEA